LTDNSNALADELDARLADADAALAAAYPGERGRRQPVHTVYVPADRYDSGTVRGWADEAKLALAAHGRSVMELAEALDLRPSVAVEVYERIRQKLDAEAVEDLRIDFEDGYGARPDEDEDAAAVAAAQALAASIAVGDAAPFHGIRVKSFEAPTRRRGVRTLQLFVRTLVEAGGLTDRFVVTLPKVTSVEQVEAFVFALDRVEESCSLEPGTLHFEIQVETPQAILAADGTALVARMIHAGGEGLPQAAERLRAYVHGGQSGFLDEPATAAAMAGFLLRGLDCGALDAAELDKLVGVDPGALAVLARRRPKA
jgi:hypothetical protein